MDQSKLDNFVIEVEKTGNDLFVMNKKIDYTAFQDSLINQYIIIKIYEVDDELEKINNDIVAKIECMLVDVDYCCDFHINIFDAFDSLGGDGSAVWSELFNYSGQIKDEYMSLENNIIILEELFVHEKYRGNGIAKMMLKEIDNILIYLAKVKFGNIALISQPLDIIDGKRKNNYDSKRKEDLNRLYQDSGFVKTNDSDDINCFVKTVDCL